MDWVDEYDPCYHCGSFEHWTEDCIPLPLDYRANPYQEYYQPQVNHEYNGFYEEPQEPMHEDVMALLWEIKADIAEINQRLDLQDQVLKELTVKALILNIQADLIRINKRLDAQDQVLEALTAKVQFLTSYKTQVYNEQSRLTNEVVVDLESNENVISFPTLENSCLNLNENLTFFKEPETQTRDRKVEPKDIWQVLCKKLHNDQKRPIRMPIFKQVFIWHINYRAYIGNSVGKCALRPP